jgi:iron-sulfur cluster insertion protein
MITLTENAILKLQDVIAEENNPALKLRVFVEGGGCSGLSQGFTLDEEQADDDWVLAIGGMTVLVDPISMPYITGATIDFKEDAMGAGFSIKNPNATGSCGCGSSFSM